MENLTTDDLRGYRVDVMPIPNGVPERWRSLCQRQGTYRFTGTADTVKLPDDVTRRLKLPLLGLVPAVSGACSSGTAHLSRSHFALALLHAGTEMCAFGPPKPLPAGSGEADAQCPQRNAEDGEQARDGCAGENWERHEHLRS